MKTENELIAEFMGHHKDAVGLYLIPEMASGRHSQLFREDQVLYSISWDWLMPVVEKITELGFNTTWNYNCETQTRYFSIYDLPYRNTAKGMQFYAEGDNCMYNAVVKFIRWYTSKNS